MEVKIKEMKLANAILGLWLESITGEGAMSRWANFCGLHSHSVPLHDVGREIDKHATIEKWQREEGGKE